MSTESIAEACMANNNHGNNSSVVVAIVPLAIKVIQ